jgi:5-methylcytosine-specific restriction endonuclease McrA
MTARLKYEYGMRSTDVTRDHVVPRSRGGKNVVANRAWACAGCNQAKGDMMPEEWRAWMAAHPDWVAPPAALDRRLDADRREGLKCASAVEQPGSSSGS